ncbi:UDP-glucose 4-epimerase GalE [Solilutibacter silvestris]|uniref:UDP-glucose 4-epimerase n=1 Tax=Solilutibacter silvestris TaxID=1645665 RepID=A0A2K1PZD4_9GAMM|nr:UDP-glucose 4-epimerase GalE [Lysobacter silvestris]PNS08154.1 galE: UDP-glucose 4-epimerase GalE [Lysobacter silvestris]
MKILVTGGAGYIGSHSCIELAASNHQVVILDNFCNASQASVARAEKLAGTRFLLHRIDLRDASAVHRLFEQERFDAVVHFAALKAVGESVEKPLEYYGNNVTGSIHLVQAMRAHGCKRLVFSSSATVYGNPDSVPVDEEAPLRVTNPYGRSKLMIEDMIRDVCASDPEFNAILLRYFNPAGAHPSGTIGEDPCGIPNNLMPYICQVAVGRRERLGIFGGDWPTIDGTGVRDYIHVVDLARAHVDAVNALEHARHPATTLNLGTGQGVSVLQLVHAFEQASGRKVPYEIVERRAGDVASVYADPRRAHDVIGWKAARDVDTMCVDAWRWQSQNPEGYGDA